MRKNTFIKIVLFLSVLGFITSLYLVKNHYEGSQQGSFCDFNTFTSCSIVNTSIYSELFNVPVALLGALWFLFLFVFALKSNKKPDLYFRFIFVWSVLGALFVFYMIAAEIILKTICPLCTFLHIIIFLVLGMSYFMISNAKKPNKKEFEKELKKNLVHIIVIFILPFILFNIYFQKENKDYTEFAKCLTDKNLLMYGSFRCGSCAKQREMFGDSFKYVVEIECHPQGENPQTERCLKMNIERTPTWILEKDGKEISRYVGFASAEKLGQMSGCDLALIKEI